MADYQATVEVLLNGLEKLEQAEQKIKAMEGKKIKVGMEVDSSSLKKLQDALDKSIKGIGGGGGASGGGILGEYRKKMASSLRNEEKALAAGEQKHLSNFYKQQAIADAKAATKLIADEYKKIGASSPEKAGKLLENANKINQNLKDNSAVRRKEIEAKQAQKEYNNRIKEEQAAADKYEKEQAKIEQQAYAARQKEQAKIARQEHAERQKELNSAFKDYDNAQIKAAKESQNRLNSYLNSARNMGASSQADALRQQAKQEADNINRIIGDSKISDSARSSIEGMRSSNASSNDAKDFIQGQKEAYKEATNQSNLYAKSLKDVYGSYQKLQSAAIKARDGSAEQEYLANQAQNLKNQYDSAKLTGDYDALSNIQKQNIDYMERAGKLQLGTVATQKVANMQAQVSNQQFRDIYNAQKQINDLKFEQSKIDDKESDAYKAYSDAIRNTAAMQASTMAKRGEMDDFEKSRINSLNQEAELRKQNYDLNNMLTDNRDAIISQNKFNAALKANSRMLKPYADDIERINDAYANATTKSQLEDANKEAQLLFSRAELNGDTGMTFLDQVKSGFKNFGASVVGQFFSAYAITRAATGVIKSMYGNVAQMDASMTELYKVTDNSEREYQEYSKGVQRTSMEIGATQTSLVQATATFARLGYNLQDSAELGKNAALFANVGDEGMTSEEAATDMVAVMKGFNLQAEDSLHIVDAFNKVGNEFAISSTGIGESLKRSGGALATANNSLEEAVGLTVAANDAMQDPAATGTALKTIALRIRGRHTCPSCSNTCPLTQYKLVA